MVRLYFDVAELEKALLAQEPPVKLDIASFKVYQSATKNGAYSPLGQIKYDPTKDFIEVTDGDPLLWYKLSYITSAASAAVESDLSEPLLGQEVASLIDVVAESLGDVNRTDDSTCAFSDDEYIRKIKSALRRYKGTERISVFLESEWEPLLMLIKISCCYDLAYDNARFFHIELPEGLKFFKGERTEHYIKLAESLEKAYARLVDDVGNEDGTSANVATFDVVQCTKKTYFNPNVLFQRGGDGISRPSGGSRRKF